MLQVSRKRARQGKARAGSSGEAISESVKPSKWPCCKIQLAIGRREKL